MANLGVSGCWIFVVMNTFWYVEKYVWHGEGKEESNEIGEHWTGSRAARRALTH